MSTNLHTRAIDNPLDQGGGLVWHRLHSEREDICEVLLKEPVLNHETTSGPSKEDAPRTAVWHKDLLQARLRKIDDALDRLLAGSHGDCAKCGRWIEDTKLEFDPAVAFCIECWQREQSRTCNHSCSSEDGQPRQQHAPAGVTSNDIVGVNGSPAAVTLRTLAPFDTIWIQTLNNDYRIFLLDPKTGRALVEGGCHFIEPVEAKVSGSVSRGSAIKNGEIGVGHRLEMWAGGKLVITSPVKTMRVEATARLVPSQYSWSQR